MSERTAQLRERLAAFLGERHREGTAGFTLAKTGARYFEAGADVVVLEEANLHGDPPKQKAPGDLISRRNSDPSISELLAASQERVNSLFQLNLTFISKFVFRSACTPIVANNPRYALFGQINEAKLFNDHHLHVAKALRLNKPEQLRRIVGMKPDAAC